ncbi:MAG: hypothetical protein RBS88_03835, partial [Spongiibacteraceae bacterium]|nr:hypothetical protein [Spongiibacteraceae bacterium]
MADKRHMHATAYHALRPALPPLTASAPEPAAMPVAAPPVPDGDGERRTPAPLSRLAAEALRELAAENGGIILKPSLLRSLA